MNSLRRRALGRQLRPQPGGRDGEEGENSEARGGREGPPGHTQIRDPQVLGEALLAGATAAAGILAAGNASGLRRGTAKVGKIAVEAVSSATGAMADVIGSAAREALHTSKKHKPRPDRPITH